jgi:hypothetical protein
MNGVILPQYLEAMGYNNPDMLCDEMDDSLSTRYCFRELFLFVYILKLVATLYGLVAFLLRSSSHLPKWLM